jgi:hypothetical protein
MGIVDAGGFCSLAGGVEIELAGRGAHAQAKGVGGSASGVGTKNGRGARRRTRAGRRSWARHTVTGRDPGPSAPPNTRPYLYSHALAQPFPSPFPTRRSSNNLGPDCAATLASSLIGLTSLAALNLGYVSRHPPLAWVARETGLSESRYLSAPLRLAAYDGLQAAARPTIMKRHTDHGPRRSAPLFIAE